MENTKKGCCEDGGCCGGKENDNRDQLCDCRNYLLDIPNPHPWTLIGFK